MENELSLRTVQLISQMFASGDQPRASLLIEQCGNNLVFLEKLDAVALERFRFAALKLSRGNIIELEKVLVLAQTDWRDLLVAADFANDLEAHQAWYEKTSR